MPGHCVHVSDWLLETIRQTPKSHDSYPMNSFDILSGMIRFDWLWDVR